MRELEKGILIRVECKQHSRSDGSEEPEHFLLIVGGSQATLAAPLLKGCCVGRGGREGREATHSPDLSLITAYLVVNNSNSVETHGREEDDVMPDGCLVPFVPPCGSKSSTAWLCCPGAMRTRVESVYLCALHSPVSSSLAALCSRPCHNTKRREFLKFTRNLD